MLVDQSLPSLASCFWKLATVQRRQAGLLETCSPDNSQHQLPCIIIKLNKITGNNYFYKLEERQNRTGIPEKMESNKVSPIISQLYNLIYSVKTSLQATTQGQFPEQILSYVAVRWEVKRQKFIQNKAVGIWGDRVPERTKLLRKEFDKSFFHGSFLISLNEY